MTYRLEWRLIGRENRLLDAGEIDGDLADRASALQALHAFLLTFALKGRNDAEGYWWGRRSADADIEVQVILRHPVLPACCVSVPAEPVADREARPILLFRSASQKGEKNDIRRTDLASQGGRGPQWSDCDQAEPPWRVAPRPGSIGRPDPSRAPALSG